MRRSLKQNDSSLSSDPPDFTLLGNSLAEDPSFCSHLYNLSDSTSFDSHLLPQVPSPSLPLEEMLGLWPSSQGDISSSTDKECEVSLLGTRRDSVATLVNFGDWVLGQSRNRASSLLPPAPLLYDNPSVSEHAGVDCHLMSPAPSTTTQDLLERGAIAGTLNGSCSPLHEATVKTGNTSSSNTRPTTPVPSLSHSHYSSSSVSSIEQASPDHALMGREPAFGPDGANMRSPTGDKSIADTYEMRPSDDIDYLLPRLPDIRTSTHQPEVSYIDWDDGDDLRSQSRLARMKKSFADLRAAERYIFEATASSKTPLLKHKSDTIIPGPGPTRPNSHESPLNLPEQKWPELENHHGDAKPLLPKETAPAVVLQQQTIRIVDKRAKLRKRPSTTSVWREDSQLTAQSSGHAKRDRRRTVSSGLEAMTPPSQVTVEQGLTANSPLPATAPSCTPKRRRFGTTLFRSSQGDKATARLSVVGRWVKRVLRLKKKRIEQ